MTLIVKINTSLIRYRKTMCPLTNAKYISIVKCRYTGTCTKSIDHSRSIGGSLYYVMNYGLLESSANLAISHLGYLPRIGTKLYQISRQRSCPSNPLTLCWSSAQLPSKPLPHRQIIIVSKFVFYNKIVEKYLQYIVAMREINTFQRRINRSYFLLILW